MQDFGLEPRPPQWALDAGLPEPHEGETFCQYAARLGLDVPELLVDLTEQTMCLANYRLATLLQRSMPQEYDQFVHELVLEHVPKERREELWISANVIWGDRLRRPAAVA